MTLLDRLPLSSEKRRQRSFGRIALSLTAEGGRTRVANLDEAGPLRVRVPRGLPHFEAMLLNTGGGIACGDRLSLQLRAGENTDATFTSQAAERVYRSDGPIAEIETSISVAAGGNLHWLPQETILFDQARLRRRFDIDIARGGTLLACEQIVFGRAASGEVMQGGLLHDVWRVRRGGALIYADSLHLDGGITDQLARPALGGGARALATVLHIAEDAETRLDEARALLAASACECGASAWRGMLVVRFLGPEIGPLRNAIAAFLAQFTGRPMPRAWML